VLFSWVRGEELIFLMCQKASLLNYRSNIDLAFAPHFTTLQPCICPVRPFAGVLIPL
jgi:hypothetical protein